MRLKTKKFKVQYLFVIDKIVKDKKQSDIQRYIHGTTSQVPKSIDRH